uniref:Histone-lysine N-methyltransferase n=1 Tax=Kalanchoe fedtschenkoi TaxID=63787 RepID=A0A7N0UD35_KALFE
MYGDCRDVDSHRFVFISLADLIAMGKVMETIFEQENGTANAPFDKSRVLDVKPLRTLIPIFPETPLAQPFVTSPSGPFPPGYMPFYPFSAPHGSYNNGNAPFDQSTASPTPIRAYRSPQPVSSIPPQFSNGDTGMSMNFHEEYEGEDGYTGSRKQKKARKRQSAVIVPRQKLIEGLEPTQREDGSAEIVDCVRTMFDALRRRLCQVEEARDGPSGRVYTTAATILASNNFKTNTRRRIGNVPGIEIGDIFFYRIEMCLVGLHALPMAGIDFLSAKGEGDGEPLAVSIVSSGGGGYDNAVDDKDVLIYSGQGGSVNKVQVADQKLEKGNLALEKSLRRGNEIRVIRGFPDPSSPSNASRIYVYDGLYKITKSWTETAKPRGSIFKFQLVRSPGQPSAFSVWKSIEKWKDGLASRAGLILPDLTSGAENIPVSLVNDVDDEKGPAYFTYFPSLKYSKPFTTEHSTIICDCHKPCTAGDPSCHCLRKNRGDLPYTCSGILVCRKPLLYECGSSCQCFSGCKNRVSQSGLKVRLEVFKTTDRGWGLRSWDPIRAGGLEKMRKMMNMFLTPLDCLTTPLNGTMSLVYSMKTALMNLLMMKRRQIRFV